MFTLAQPACHFYNPYEELAMQQELQRRRHIEAYLRQREAEEMKRRRAERVAELERRRQAEFGRRRLARGRYSMCDGGMESLLGALYGGRSQAQPWRQQEGLQNDTARKPTTTPARNSTPTPVPLPEPTPAEPKLDEDPQVDTAPSYTAVQLVLSTFTALQSDFTFTTRLDFEPNTSKLAYTPNNASLHGYEHALTGLLTQLDAVESYGDDGVRRARKEAVKMIEKELERLDGIKVEVWRRTHELEVVKSSTGTEVDPAFVPLPEDDVRDAEMEDSLQTGALESTIDQRSVLEETLANQTEPTASSEVEVSTPLEHVDTDIAPASTPSLDTGHTVPGHMALASPQTPSPEPLTRSLTSPSPSEISESDSDSDLELEEYVDIETVSASEDEGTDLEEVENDGDLELMGDWDMDF
ncbi:unnamed protein product [Rhizoctonia solani]|uniref:BAG domain-containing protein n=1 Tax=Rhizoctonia solani TaxID=456999 RepID=A0A8H2X3L6_9AGAM|nr:unnamed protein product [Rhizoctonia solani]